ncbi:MAG TPA: glycosyltransferase [Chloroflexota bacterium]|nr:glycosyltransferase [Chloroflexota bacterium]
MRVSLIATVLNEEQSIDALLASIAAQTRPPDEVVIVDGGSRDRTVARIRAWGDRIAGLRLISCPGASIAVGRNRAIAAATGDVIACTDAGVRLDPRWLERIIEPLARGADVAMGFFVADPRTLFERALGATTLPDVDEIVPDRFIPSSRSIAYTRRAWEIAGGYPEWLDYCEDVVFDLALRRAGLRFAWVPGAVVYFRPRPSLAAFFRQYFLYARGDGKANLWLHRHVIRYLTYLGAPLVFRLGFWYNPAWLALGLGGCLYLQRPYRRLIRAYGRRFDAHLGAALLLVPLLRLVGDLAKMLGYPVGVWWRLRGGGRCLTSSSLS